MKKRAWILKPIGEQITRLMKEKGMDLPALVEATGLSRGYLSDLTRGKVNNPSLEVLARIATALGVEFRIPGKRLLSREEGKERSAALVYESELAAKGPIEEGQQVVNLDAVEVDLGNPAVKLLARLLGDRTIPYQARKRIEKYTIELVEWFAAIVRNQSDED